MHEPKPRVAETRSLARATYYSNYYARALTGRCIPFNTETVEPEKSCKWGNAFQGGCQPVNASLPVSKEEGELAMEVIQRFDMCMVMEWMGHPSFKAWITELFSLKYEARFRRSNPTRLARRYPVPNMSPESYWMLKEDNLVDFQLYEACINTSSAMIKSMGLSPPTTHITDTPWVDQGRKDRLHKRDRLRGAHRNWSEGAILGRTKRKAERGKNKKGPLL